jgi:hypothetical protein
MRRAGVTIHVSADMTSARWPRPGGLRALHRRPTHSLTLQIPPWSRRRTICGQPLIPSLDYGVALALLKCLVALPVPFHFVSLILDCFSD